MKHYKYVWLWLCLLLMGCNTTPTPQPSISPSFNIPVKPTLAPPDSIKLGPAHYEVTIEGGMTDAARHLLESGETAYLVIAFAAHPSDATQKALTKKGVVFDVCIGPGVYMTTVPPRALPVLEQQAQVGTLRMAMLVPAEAKITPELAQKMATLEPSDILTISVNLYALPNDAQKVALTQWLQIVDESFTEDTIGRIENKNIMDIASYPLVRLVSIAYGGSVD